MARRPDRQQLNIVIVGHVDHGKSTLVGRLFADTGALPEGKLEAVRRDVPAHGQAVRIGLPAGRPAGRAGPGHHHRHRPLLLQDRPARLHHHRRPRAQEFLKNMITGAARAEAAVLIIDAKEGVREKTPPPRLHPAAAGHPPGGGVREQDGSVGYVRGPVRGSRRVSSSRYLAALGSILRRSMSFRCRRETATTSRSPSAQDALVPRTDADSRRSMRCRCRSSPPICRCDCAIQDVYKFDERRIIAGRIESGRLHVGDTLLFSPTDKIAPGCLASRPGHRECTDHGRRGPVDRHYAR